MAFRIATALSLLVASALSAQRPPALTRLEAGTCPSCAISLELVATLGNASDAELLSQYGQVTSLADGGFLVTSPGQKAALLRYDSHGKYIGMLGRRGDGPGEFQQLRSVVRARGDSISIMGMGRLTTISTRTGRGRSEPIASDLNGFFHTVLADGSVMIDVDAQHNLPFALLTQASALRKTFGPPPLTVVLPNQNGHTIVDHYNNLALLAPSRVAGVWAASLYYSQHIQRLGNDGAVLMDIRRHPAWFAPYTYADVEEKVDRLGELRTPRPTIVTGVGVDSSGHVLVVSRVADAHWKKDPNAPAPHSADGEYRVEKLVPTGGIDRYVDGVLEVYDDKSGAFIGSWRSDTALGSLTQNGLLYTQAQDADGITTIKVYRIRVASAK